MEEISIFYGHFVVIWYIFPLENLEGLLMENIR
jgi:hypothetical protein